MDNNILELVVKAADSKHADNILVYDVKEITTAADFYMIASADSNRQVGAISDEIIFEIKKSKIDIRRVEGSKYSDWILIDLGNIIINILKTDQRKHYNLENLWSNSKCINI